MNHEEKLLSFRMNELCGLAMRYTATRGRYWLLFTTYKLKSCDTNSPGQLNRRGEKKTFVMRQ